jgi:DNA-binding response OmpR family regulator
MSAPPLVLLLDKDEALLEVVMRQLGEAKIGVDVAADAAEAASKSAEHPYAVVLLDIDEPALEGRAYLAAMKSDRLRPTVIVVHASESHPSLDPELVTVTVRKPYDAQVISSMLLACATRRLPGKTPSQPAKELSKC